MCIFPNVEWTINGKMHNLKFKVNTSKLISDICKTRRLGFIHSFMLFLHRKIKKQNEMLWGKCEPKTFELNYEKTLMFH